MNVGMHRTRSRYHVMVIAGIYWECTAVEIERQYSPHLFVLACRKLSQKIVRGLVSPWQAVSGTATVLVAPGKKVEHLGIKAELIGQIGKSMVAARGLARVEKRRCRLIFAAVFYCCSGMFVLCGSLAFCELVHSKPTVGRLSA